MKITKFTTELLVVGGVILAAFNFFMKPGNTCSGFSLQCSTELLYFISVAMIVLGLARLYVQKRTDLFK